MRFVQDGELPTRIRNTAGKIDSGEFYQICETLLKKHNRKQLAMSAIQLEAVRKHWKDDYVGESDEALLQDLNAVSANVTNLYAKYMNVVQSSGTGKSKTIQQISTKVFTVPFVIREDGTGFPPTDTEIRDFLLAAEKHDDL